jgi:alanine dehydrogenase
VVVGVPSEIKQGELRVSITPAGARELKMLGHAVVVQIGAGHGSGFPDEAYRGQGAEILPSADAVFDAATLIVKVKEPQLDEVSLLHPHHTLFTYLHLAAEPELVRALMESGATCVAYETIEDRSGRLPLLAPMSEIAGKLAAMAGAQILTAPHGGPGVLIGGVPGVAPARVMIIGAGAVGLSAARVAAGLGAETFIYDRSVERLREIEALGAQRWITCFASSLEIEERLSGVDLVIGAVLVPGARAPHVLTRPQLALMRPGTVVVDVSIDQGGSFETSRPTTHAAPTYVVDDVIHYCVTNMPGAVPRSSTAALTNATIPFIAKLAEDASAAAVVADSAFSGGLNIAAGAVVNEAVAIAHGLTPAVAAA